MWYCGVGIFNDTVNVSRTRTAGMRASGESNDIGELMMVERMRKNERVNYLTARNEGDGCSKRSPLMSKRSSNYNGVSRTSVMRVIAQYHPQCHPITPESVKITQQRHWDRTKMDKMDKCQGFPLSLRQASHNASTLHTRLNTVITMLQTLPENIPFPVLFYHRAIYQWRRFRLFCEVQVCHHPLNHP